MAALRGILVRVTAATTSREMAPAARRAKATSTGETARSPSLIHQNEQPQMAPKMTNDASQGN